MRPVFVSGLAGFIGSHCAERLIESGQSVVGVDDLSGGVERNVPKGAQLIRADICDSVGMERLFEYFQPSAVIHTAAFASENLSHNCRLHTYRSIVQGTATLVNAAVNHGNPLFVAMSSIAVYGHQLPPFAEEDTPDPADPYGCAKTCMEMDLHAAHEQFGLDSIIFRPHNVLGVRQNLSDSTRNVASIFIRQALQGIPLTIYGDGNQTRAFSPVSHVSAVIVASLARQQCRNSIYNVGGNRVMTVLDLAHMVLDLTDSKSEINFLPERKEAKHAHSDHTQVSEDFSDICEREQESISHCLAGMIDEAKRYPLPPLQPLPRIEITENLPDVWKSLTSQNTN